MLKAKHMQDKTAQNQATPKNDTKKPGAPPVDASKPIDLVKPTATKDDPIIDKAVDDITAKESDELLKAEDKELGKAFTDKPKNLKEKIVSVIKNWWNNPKARWLSIG